MHRFNVATFVNLLIVGLAATTISLFVFGLPKENANVRTNAPSDNAVANVGDATGETIEETSIRESDAALTEGAVDSLFAEEAVEVETENDADAVETDAVDALFAEEAVEEAEIDDLNSLFAEDAIEETEEIAVDSEAVAVEEAEEVAADADGEAVAEPLAVEETEEVAADVEVVDLDSLFAEDAIDETGEVAADSEAVAVEEAEEVASDVEVVDLDSLFAEDAIEETEKAAVDSEAVAVEEAEEVAIEAEAVSVEETDEVAIETDVADVESEVVDLDSLFAEDAIEEAADAEAIAVEEPEEVAADAETVAVEENAEVAVDPEAVAVEETEEVAADVEVVDLDSLFAEDAIEEAAAAEAIAVEETEEVAAEPETVAVEETEEVATDSEAVAVEETGEVAAEPEAVVVEETDEAAAESDVEAIDLDSLFVDDAIDADEEVAVENNSVEVADVDSLFADEAIETDAAVAEETVESDAAVAEEAVETAVVADEIAKVENLAEAQAVEPEAIAVSNAPQTVEPETAVAPIRENELWVLGQAGNGFYLYRLEGGAWVAKDVADFYADAAEFATVVYAHGYQTDMTDATRDAAAFKTVLAAARQNVGADRAFRLVVWKWNSERDAARIRIDAQSKASLADWSGKALGRFLGGLDANADFALVGFSFGARVVGSALETLAQNGAQAAALDVEFDENDEFAFAVSGQANVEENASQTNAVSAAVAEPYLSEANEGRKIALILVAAACDLGSFEARGVYGRGATLPTDVLNVYNPNDFALRYYRHVSETRSDAQGVAPLRSGVFPNAVGKTFNINSNPALGKRHAFVDAIGTVPTQTIGALAF